MEFNAEVTFWASCKCPRSSYEKRHFSNCNEVEMSPYYSFLVDLYKKRRLDVNLSIMWLLPSLESKQLTQ